MALTEQETQDFIEELKKKFGGVTNDDDKTLATEFSASKFYWQDIVLDILSKQLKAAGNEMGVNLMGFLEANQLAMLEYLSNDLMPLLMKAGTGGEGADVNIAGKGNFLENNPNAINLLVSAARTFLTNRDPSGIVWEAWSIGKDTKKRGGTGGFKAPTAEQIRQNFDVDAMAREYSDTYRGLLLDEPRDARSVAKAYVETIVKSPDQRLDWKNFMRSQIEKEPRYAAIYANKPRGMSPEQYLFPYIDAASAVLRPRDVTAAATNAAQLGASQQSFQENMARSNAVTTSAPFITNFESRMQALKGVLRG